MITSDNYNFKLHDKVTAKPYVNNGRVVLITDEHITVEEKNDLWHSTAYAPYSQIFRFYFKDVPKRGSIGTLIPLSISLLKHTDQ